MSGGTEPPLADVDWRKAVRIVRQLHVPADVFDDIADPADWPLLAAGERKTDPRIAETLGALDSIPERRRVSGPRAHYLMAPFAHASTDRQSRFSDGRHGVLYAGEHVEVALCETIHHHTVFMRTTRQAEGWTSQFREIVLDVSGRLHDLRGWVPGRGPLDPHDYAEGQALAARLRATASDGLVYPSVRAPAGSCVALFYPDLASRPRHGRRLDYHWDGQRVDYYRDVDSRQVFFITPS